MFKPGHRMPRASLVHWATCLPHPCTAEDLQEDLTLVLSARDQGLTVHARVDPDLCQCPRPQVVVSSTLTMLAWWVKLYCFPIHRGRAISRPSCDDKELSSAAKGGFSGVTTDLWKVKTPLCGHIIPLTNCFLSVSYSDSLEILFFQCLM